MYLQITEQIIIDIQPLVLMLTAAIAGIVKIYTANCGAKKAKK